MIITTTGINNKTIITRSITSTIVKTRTVCLLLAQIHHHKITLVVGTDIVSTHKNCQICCNVFFAFSSPKYVVSQEFLVCALEIKANLLKQMLKSSREGGVCFVIKFSDNSCE